jgi:small-conductance mechanosensitive channel
VNLQALLDTSLIRLGSYELKVVNLVSVLIIWAFAWLLLRGIHRLINRGLPRINWDEGRRHSLFLLAQYVVWTLAITAIFEALGVRVSVLLAGSAALLVGLGLGIQPIFRDIMSGVFLLFEGTIEVGDVIQIDNRMARVVEIKLRTTQLLTRDGITLMIPNYKFITESVVNLSHQTGIPIQFAARMTVRNDSDGATVCQILQQVALSNPLVLQHPAPEVRLLDLPDEKALVFQMLVWTQEKFGAERLLSDLRLEGLKQLQAAGIRLPE